VSRPVRAARRQAAIVRLPEIDFIDDKAGKPVGIHKFIGKRPVAAFGNSDGDFEMLEWTTSAPGARLGLIVHHDDGTPSMHTTATAPSASSTAASTSGEARVARRQHEERLADVYVPHADWSPRNRRFRLAWRGGPNPDERSTLALASAMRHPDRDGHRQPQHALRFIGRSSR